MPTATSRGTSVSTVGTWTTEANAYDAGTATFASWASSTANAQASITVSGYGFGSVIPDNASALGPVTVIVKQYVSSTTYIASKTVQAYVGSTAKGSAVTLGNSTSSTYSQTVTLTGLTLADVEDATFGIRLTTNHNNSTTAGTQYVDYLQVSVEYQTSMGNLRDEFTSTVEDTSRWMFDYDSGAGYCNVSGGIMYLDAEFTNSYGDMSSRDFFDVRNSYVAFELPSGIGSSDINAALVFGFWSGNLSNQTDFYFFCQAGHCYLNYMNSSGTQFTILDLIYSSTTHRWMRLREANGTMYADTSPNGLDWTNRASIATATAFPEAYHVKFYIRPVLYVSYIANSASIDNVNAPRQIGWGFPI